MHNITTPTTKTADFLYPASDTYIKGYVFEKRPLPPGRELFATKFNNLVALKEITRDLTHNRSHAGAGTKTKNFVTSGAFFAFLVNLLMPFAMVAAFMGLVKFEVATIGHPVLMFGAVLLTLVVIGFFISRLLGPLDWWYYVNYLDAEDVEASGFTVESNPISMRWFRLTSTPPA